MKRLVIAVMLLISTVLYSSANSLSGTYRTSVKSNFDESVKIKLILGNKTYELQSYSLTYFRPDNSKTNITSNDVLTAYSPYQKSNISIMLRSSKVDQELLNWLLAPEQQSKDGQIIVSDGDSGKILKTVTFTGANTASYNENNNTNTFGGNPQFSNFSLSYKSISVKY
ncbi:MAG: type VI secretion system tube protein TssD [Janthinobacterium lividum]